MDDGKKGFVDAMAEHQKTYRSVMSVVTEQIDVIESSLASNVPIEVLVQELNEHFKLNTNSSTVNKCLYRLRKKRPRSDKFAETANDQVTTIQLQLLRKNLKNFSISMTKVNYHWTKNSGNYRVLK